MTRTDRISANVGRLLASMTVWPDQLHIDKAVERATSIEDAVDAAERDYKGLPPKNLSTGEPDETPERWRKGGCV